MEALIGIRETKRCKHHLKHLHFFGDRSDISGCVDVSPVSLWIEVSKHCFFPVHLPIAGQKTSRHIRRLKTCRNHLQTSMLKMSRGKWPQGIFLFPCAGLPAEIKIHYHRIVVSFSEDSNFLDEGKSWLHRVGWLSTRQGPGGGTFAGHCFGRTDEKVSQSGA